MKLLIARNLVSSTKDIVDMSSPVPVVLSGCYKNYYKIQKTKCTECHNLMAATSIARHMKTVHRAQTGKQIKCDDCRKILQTKDRLVQHQKSHLFPSLNDPSPVDPSLNNHELDG